MRWQSFHHASQKLEDRLQNVAAEHNRLFVLLRELEKGMESKRSEQKTQQQQLDAAQGDYYAVVAEVGRLEQAIKHNEKSHEETLAEINRLKQQAEQASRECEQDRLQLEEIRQTLLEAEETMMVAKEREEDMLGHAAGGADAKTAVAAAVGSLSGGKRRSARAGGSAARQTDAIGKSKAAITGSIG